MMRRMGAVIWATFLGLLIGCGGESPKPTKIPVPPAPKPAQTPAKVSPAAEEIKFERPTLLTFTYDPRGKPDPFRPLVVEKPEVPPPPASKVPPKPTLEPGTPLERFDLSQLKLVAIIWNIKEPRAMVEDSAGKGYIISAGTNIGKNKGVVTKINSTGVVVTEKIEDASGKISTRDTVLKLYAD